MNKKLLTFAAITSLTLATPTLLHADNDSKESDKTQQLQKDVSPLSGLDLSPEQTLQIASIDESYNPRFEALHEKIQSLKEQYKNLDSSSPNYAQNLETLDSEKVLLMEENKTIKSDHNTEINAVLTDEQKLEMETRSSE